MVNGRTKQQRATDPVYYVGIGASAGGLDALESFVKKLPPFSGHAFIIVQHLSPDFKSMMPELLARHTKIPIQQITEDIKLEANNIYLAPPRKYVLMAEGKALLVDQMEGRETNFPIDVFFRSLAEDQHNRSIAVILSGTGSDGSRGIQAVKEVGGLVIVQEPSNATFDGMPYSAINTGCADLVINTEVMAEKIMQYTSHPIVSGEKLVLPDDKDHAKHAMNEIYHLLSEKTNIDFSHYKGNTVARRIERRLAINGLNNVNEYYSLLLKNPKELSTLSQDMLIGVTRFFRDNEAFQTLENTVIPEIIRNSGEKDIIRVWCAGCSTGEEAYSIAMIIDEALQNAQLNRTVRIFATDVDGNAIEEAAQGQYSLNIAGDISEERLNNYFIRKDDYFTISPNVRQMVIFAQHNLLKDPPFSNCQLAICRNALIYFQAQAQKRILSMLHFSLNRNGYLFLGSSESLGEMIEYFDAVDERNRIFQKISSTKLLVEAIPSGMVDVKKTETKSYASLLAESHHVQKRPNYLPVLEKIIEYYSPPGLILSENQQVLHVFGDISPFTQKLRSGRFNSSVTELIIDSLSVAVSTAINKAKTMASGISYKDIAFTNEIGETACINLRVVFLKSGNLSANYYVLFFEQLNTIAKAELVSDEQNISDIHSKQLIADLEQALRQNQEDLQISVEELQTTNEELQSSNEELMAANEELQSTNEELQSVNEELYSVNSEYQEKIEAVSQSNTDMDNLINSAEFNFIFLDDALLVRKFSKNVTEDFNLLESDIGRPFHHVSHCFEYPDFIKDITGVIKTEKQKVIRLTNKNNRHKLVKISPYVDEKNKTFGCVIGLTDITHITHLEQRLDQSLKALRSTLATEILNQEKTISLLIVDDDDVDRERLIRGIEKPNPGNAKYNIEQAKSFDDAQKLLNEKTFDIAIIDFFLDGHVGFELIKNLSKNNNDLAFILLSGEITDKMREEAINYNVFDVLDKAEISSSLIQRSIISTYRHKQTEQFLISQQ